MDKVKNILDSEEQLNNKRWLLLKARIAEENIKKAVRLLLKHGFEPILIKGWAAAREYPEKHLRGFGDIDLSVAPEKFEKCKEFIKNAGAEHLNIDLHRGLRHLDTVRWEDLFANSLVVDLDEVPVRILCSEDHLRVLCVHWLTDGGAYRERLLDIYYLLENNAETFDWHKCFGKIDANRRDWIIKTIAVVHNNYPLNLSKLPFAEELNNVPRWFLRALEKEWASDVRLQPIHVFINNRKEFWKQFKKRLPPNAIQATIEMNGKFNNTPRIIYQIGSILLRLKPSIKRTIFFIKGQYSNNLEKK